jgi:hypothetical protein
MLGAAIRTCEQRVLSVERDRTDRSLDGVVVERNMAPSSIRRVTITQHYVSPLTDSWCLSESLFLLRNASTKIFKEAAITESIDRGNPPLRPSPG